ncbi:heavy metal-binding domain-containing protein [Vibrio fortis]|uniref:heavy metal-binding domain-containing protein n=2 Tax=Vibrio TaxID=662 RepID=UPI0038CDADA4
MIYTTTETVPGKEIEAVLGIVNGNVVQSKHVGRDIMAGLKGIVGGELKGYTEMLMEARNIAVERLIEDAQKLNADAIVGIRFTTSSVTDGASEILVFGTAVKLQKITSI